MSTTHFLVALICCLWLSAVAGAAPPDADLMKKADALIDEAIAKHETPGAVMLVGRGDEIVYRKAYGNKSLLPTTQPMTPDTIFDLASLSKSVGCATSIMVLADRGKLKVTDPVAKYIPEFAQNGKEEITIEDLLLHRGGLVADNPLADYDGPPAESIRRICSARPQKEPKKSFVYSDVGYIMLGELVRVIDGRTLDKFAHEEIFEPLGMKETAYNPPAEWKPRIAPTEKRGDHWMVGEVHDPRAFRLGGVAGHAGVFSTADDLSILCRMILGGGSSHGKKILSKETVAEMIKPRYLPDHTAGRTYGFDVSSAYASARGERFELGVTFGHTGYTGTMFWLDPKNDCYLILLTNRVHPNDKTSVTKLRKAVATCVAEALLGPVAPAAGGAADGADGRRAASGPPAQVMTGIDVLKAQKYKSLEGRKIGLITNHTGRDREGNRTVDLLTTAPNLKIAKLFSPEHGLYGKLDEKISNTTDDKTGLPVYSLYGKTTRPNDEMLDGVDTLVFDIQDVGARFYTYISTMGICMEEASKRKIRFVVLDRPNPITGLIVDGPLAQKQHFGFTAYGPIPVAHGMTVGELARLYNEAFKINCELQVVECQNWQRAMWFDETGLTWVNPSPNMRNVTQALLYTATGLLEASNVSVGRGTDQPFELFGAPWVDGTKLAAALNGAQLPGLRFVPIEFTPTTSKYKDALCRGVYIVVTDRNVVEPIRSGLTFAHHLKQLFPKDYQVENVGKMIQNADVQAFLQQGKDPALLPTTWQKELDEFKALRAKYLIYK